MYNIYIYAYTSIHTLYIYVYTYTHCTYVIMCKGLPLQMTEFTHQSFSASQSRHHKLTAAACCHVIARITDTMREPKTS